MTGFDEALPILDRISEPSCIGNFIYSVQNCRKGKNVSCARRAHENIFQHGLEVHRHLGNHIVPMLVECGSMLDAQQVFCRLIDRNEHCWTFLISGYIEYGQLPHAMRLYEQMQRDGIQPSTYTFVALLRACASIKNMEIGRLIHAEIRQNRLEKNVFVGSTLVHMYAKCGFISEARNVFDNMAVRTAVSWNVLIGAYAENGLAKEALRCFDLMQLDGISPDAATYISCLKACGSLGAIKKGRKLHVQIMQEGYHKDLFVGNTLMDMYAKFGSLREAREIFNNLPIRNVVCWTTLIAGYMEHGFAMEALVCFDSMQLEGIRPNIVTFLCSLKACGSTGALDKGKELHIKIVQMGYEGEMLVISALIDMYANCGALQEAQEIFDKLSDRNVLSWNALIAGYGRNGFYQEAIDRFILMQMEGVPPDAITLVYSLKACAEIGAIEKGREIHTSYREFEKELYVANTLMSMYAQCGLLAEAREVFLNLPVKNVVTWTTLIAAYVENGNAQEALNCLDKMKLEGMFPDAVTFACCLKACGSIGAIEKGRKLHKEVIQNGFQNELFVGNVLIDMYAKCGSLAEAQETFDKLPFRDIISWNAIIRGCGINHETGMAMQYFKDMEEQAIKPDAITFVCLLTACSRASLVSKGQEYYMTMKENYDITPTIDHHACIIDLLARAGYLCEALKLLQSIHCVSKVTWLALLAGCKTYGEAEVARRCFLQLVQVDSKDAVSYILMENIYASDGRWDDVNKIEQWRKEADVIRRPARALIEVKNTVHEFVVGDNANEEISTKLETVGTCIKEHGHVPNLDLVLRPISDQEKEASLCGHAEKLAITFGLLHTSEGETLRVTKNTRMCNDCHSIGKIISRTKRREIIIIESNWLHQFKDGLCSCGDIW